MMPTEYGTSVGADPELIKSAARRLWQKVNRGNPSDCWEWLGIIKPDGYAQIRIGRQRRPYVHRLAYELEVGPVPKDMFLLHRCDNRRCCNPAHLFTGTHQDNMKDRNAKGRQSTARGERNGNAILTGDQVREIRCLKGSERRDSIAARFGVSPSTIDSIWYRRHRLFD